MTNDVGPRRIKIAGRSFPIPGSSLLRLLLGVALIAGGGIGVSANPWLLDGSSGFNDSICGLCTGSPVSAGIRNTYSSMVAGAGQPQMSQYPADSPSAGK